MPSLMPTKSAADAAFEVYKALRATDQLASRAYVDLSEADTRAKLIDPIFKAILGWHEPDIRREEPVAAGFVDYVLGADHPYLHIEAKRINPRFELVAPSKPRILKLSGPHLLGRKDLKPFLEQAARYAPELGTSYAVLTNGDQFIIFCTHPHGKSWREGHAIVWHDHDDISDDFANFFDLLSRDRVRSGSLSQAFAAAEGATATYFLPLEFVHNPDFELVRNPFWNKLARVVGPLLTDDPGATEIQDEIVQHCYVRTPLSDEVDRSINALIHDQMPKYLVDADAVDLRPGMGGRTGFDHSIEADIKEHRPGTYILTGGVGSGKTTFLRRFERVVAARFVKEWCVWLHVDYLPIGHIEAERLDSELNAYTFRRIRELILQHYPELAPSTGEQLREVFAPQISAARMTLLFGLEPNSDPWHQRVNQLVHELSTNDQVFVMALLNAANRSSRRIVIVLDNTDQQGEKFQESVFLLSQRLSRESKALTIVALREEKFFAAYRRGIFDAYGDRRFHIGSPNLAIVIRQRLKHALRTYVSSARPEATTAAKKAEINQVERVIEALIRSATQRNQNIVRLLACVSGGDMRHALGMFKDFVSSGNTDISKILSIVAKDGGYTVPFHEFAKSAILGARRYYRSSKSHIVNVFSRSAAAGASHFAALRILARLANAATAASRHGQGFVDTVTLLGEYRQSFGRADDFISRGQELLSRGLIESEPPKAQSIDATEALRITASGMYYWRYLVRAFAYIDLVYLDTALAHKETATRLASMADVTDLAVRFERVRVFLDYLQDSEADEIKMVGERGGPYAQSLINGIRNQIETEISVIQRKKRVRQLH